MTKNKSYLLLLGSIISISSLEGDLNSEWFEMQKYYKQCVLQVNQDKNTYDKLVHPDWQNKCKSLVAHILGSSRDNFLIHPILQSSMIRGVQTKELSEEEDFLINHISGETKQLLNKYKETSVGGITWKNKIFNCTGNSVSQMSFFAKILELKKRNVKHIIEFGGGYGNLARIAKMCMPDITYIIIDLPEICAIQSLYLNLSLPGTTKAHVKAPLEFEPGFIHLVPVYLLDKISINDSDVFVSTFAITESTLYSQNIVTNKNFFGSSLCYVVGLVSSPKWVSITPLINNIKKYFSNFTIQRFNHHAHIHEIRGLR